MLGRVLHTLVKSHGNGGAQVGLDLHTLFRPHEDAVAVQMGSKGHALFVDLAQFGQTEHLESAAVGQDGAVPAGELVQTAQVGHQLVAGAQMEMVGVAQHDLCADVLQVMGRQAALDGTRGGHILESRGLHRAVHGFEFAPPGIVFLFQELVRCQRRHKSGSFLCTENSRAVSQQKTFFCIVQKYCNRAAAFFQRQSWHPPGVRAAHSGFAAACRSGYRINIASPKLKKRYLSETATS